MKKLKAIIAVIFALTLIFAFGCSNGGSGGSVGSSASNGGSAGTQNGTLKIEKAENIGGKIVITFNGVVTDFVPEDFHVESTADWYTLKPGFSDCEIVDYSLETVGGKTVATLNAAPEKSEEDKALIVSWANNAITWQIPDNGGWDKDYDKHISAQHASGAPYVTKGWTYGGKDLGTIDNDATYSEMRLIAEAYEITREQKFLDSFIKGMKFLDDLQYPSGGLAQVYPRRNNYSDYVTFNDNAMVNVLIEMENLAAGKYPYTAIATDELKAQAESMIELGVDYILKSQITVNGEKAAWCAQHDPVNYAPKEARAYELPSVSGSESVGVIKFLLHQRDNPEAIAAAEAALKWLEPRKMVDTNFDKNGRINPETGETEYFYYEAGKNLWWRFYDLETGRGFFSDRTSGKFFDIAEIEEERRLGYSWTGNWPEKLIGVYNEYGYFADKVKISVVGNATSSAVGKLNIGDEIEG